MSQTYCVQADIESILSASGALACVDDAEVGSGGTGHITNAIERAAVKMNAAIGRQYTPLSDLASNDWCKWANATLAAFYLSTRRNNPAPATLADQVKEIEELLDEIAWGKRTIPDAVPSFNQLPSVTNFTVEPGRIVAPVRVNRDESTGSDPPSDGQRKRYYANQPGIY